MSTTDLRQPRPRRVAQRTVRTALAAITLALGSACGSPASAQQTAPDHAVRAAELEREFWRCDHLATRTRLDFASAARCSAITEELRRQRSGGDFDAMLGWWRERKTAEHRALDAATAPAHAAREAPSKAPPPPRPAGASAPEQQPHSASAPANPFVAGSPEELKRAYLHCDRLARTERFDADAAAACSMVYEALKARVFGGSTERLIAWMRQQPGTMAGEARAAARP